MAIKQDKVQILDNDIDAVRKLPDVYIGALGDPGVINMFREIVQNALDGIMKNNTDNYNIIVSFDNRTYTFIIEDFGQGIPLDVLVQVYSILHSSSNYDKVEGSGNYSSGKNGMGSTITNYLSKFFIAESYRDNGELGKNDKDNGQAARVEFSEGVLTKHESIKCPKGRHGVKVMFAPSDMMGELTFTDQDIFNLLSMIVPLNKIGTKITYNSINKMGQKHQVIIENKYGIMQHINGICERKVVEPVYFMEDNGTMKVEVLFTYDVLNMDDPVILSFANGCPTESGTHVDGFYDALVKYFRDYMNKIYLVNNRKKLTVNIQDIKTGLRAVISVYHLKPMYTGQSKQIFSKEDMKPYMANIALKSIDNWAKANPNDLQKVCKYLKEVCEIRSKVDNEKVKMSDKYTSSVITGLPDKYVKPNGKKNIEVIIVEGDSAKGGIVNNRNNATQGVMPIRGKITNAFTAPPAKFFANEEVSGLFKIFGYKGYSKKFDPDKFIPEKVILMTDADSDGAHIRYLCFCMFLKYLPFVIEQGKLYAACAPLYSTKGKNKRYFIDEAEFVEYVKEMFIKENTVCNAKGKKYSDADLFRIVYRNNSYCKEIDKVSNDFAINPYMLEFLLINRNKPFKEFKRLVEKKYAAGQTKVLNQNGVTMIDGLVDSKIHTIFFSDRLINACQKCIEFINKSENEYMLNGNVVSLYGLMSTYESFKPDIQRYKGLGEMNPKDLGESTVIPGKGRTLKRYTIEDVKKEIEFFKYVQTDKSAFVKDIMITKDDIV